MIWRWWSFAIPGTSDIAFAGKQGVAYLLDTNKMGEYHRMPTSFYRMAATTDNGFSGVFNKTMYIWGVNQPLLAYRFNGTASLLHLLAKHLRDPTDRPTARYLFRRTVSRSTAIVWATAPTADPQIRPLRNLFAFDATNLANLLWSTTQIFARRVRKFREICRSTIANGRVYVATNNTPDRSRYMACADGLQHQHFISFGNRVSGGSATVSFSVILRAAASWQRNADRKRITAVHRLSSPGSIAAGAGATQGL